MTAFTGNGRRLGPCEFCGEDAFVKAILRKGTSRNAKRVRLDKTALVCPTHATSFWRQGVEIT